MRRILAIFCCGVVLAGCGAGKASYSPQKKYSLRQVQRDYNIYQHILEDYHPGLYWYTSRDSMNTYFEQGREKLRDSMTEADFRILLSYVTAKINCGHTSIRASKKAMKFTDTTRTFRIFPLSMKLWQDTMVVAANLNRFDTILKRATVITSINGLSTKQIEDSLFSFISTDGYNLTHKYQTLSNRGYFGSLYSSVFGISPLYTIGYLNAQGQERFISIPAYNPATDTAGRRMVRPPAERLPAKRPSKKEIRENQLNNVRLLQIDTVNHSAMMNLASFGRGYGLKSFFRRSFKTLAAQHIRYLIIDVRSNGGGSVTNSTLISRYLTDHSFKIGDSLYAIRKKGPYRKYIQNHFVNRLFMSFFTQHHRDGNYHFGYFERHHFSPKKKNHFNGNVYILTGGNSFSATTLFVSTIIKQDNVTVIGEETGGGAYGNSAWLIPDVTLPETKVRFRLPLFRLVIDSTLPKNGRGVQPEIFAGPTTEAIRTNADYKLEKALQLINADKLQNANRAELKNDQHP